MAPTSIPTLLGIAIELSPFDPPQRLPIDQIVRHELASLLVHVDGVVEIRLEGGIVAVLEIRSVPFAVQDCPSPKTSTALLRKSELQLYDKRRDCPRLDTSRTPRPGVSGQPPAGLSIREPSSGPQATRLAISIVNHYVANHHQRLMIQPCGTLNVKLEFDVLSPWRLKRW